MFDLFEVQGKGRGAHKAFLLLTMSTKNPSEALLTLPFCDVNFVQCIKK